MTRLGSVEQYLSTGRSGSVAADLEARPSATGELSARRLFLTYVPLSCCCPVYLFVPPPARFYIFLSALTYVIISYLSNIYIAIMTSSITTALYNPCRILSMRSVVDPISFGDLQVSPPATRRSVSRTPRYTFIIPHVCTVYASNNYSSLRSPCYASSYLYFPLFVPLRPRPFPPPYIQLHVYKCGCFRVSRQTGAYAT